MIMIVYIEQLCDIVIRKNRMENKSGLVGNPQTETAQTQFIDTCAG